jgi:hypothetical protein
MDFLSAWFPSVFNKNGLEIGPIPKGTPVGLLANLPLVSESARLKDQEEHFNELLKLLKEAARDLQSLPANATDDQAREVFASIGERLLKLSKCPDFVVNRGHYFGTNLSDDDKWALIEFLKTF